MDTTRNHHASDKPDIKRIVIAGAGAIGNYVGVQLHQAGFILTFLASKRIVDAERQYGLTLEYPDKPDGGQVCDVFSPAALDFTTDASCCADADLIIITAKSLVTETLISQIKPHLKTSTILLTLQNGIRNLTLLKTAFPDNVVCGGMVTFNVIERSAPTFRLTTRGEIYLQKSSPSLLPVFLRAGLAVTEKENMDSILWSKLLLNLINPLNALSGLSLKQNLSDRQFRLRWAGCMREGLAVLKAAGIKPAKVTPLPPSLLPFMLSLPNWIYLALAKNMTEMDPTARSSMAQDLARGRPTEIDYLSGELIRLGKQTGIPTPENEKVYASVKQAEKVLGFS